MSITVHKVKLNPSGTSTPINLPDCYTRIAEIAYYKAERSGFRPGRELDDWLEAEREFNEELVKKVTHLTLTSQ